MKFGGGAHGDCFCALIVNHSGVIWSRKKAPGDSVIAPCKELSGKVGTWATAEFFAESQDARLKE